MRSSRSLITGPLVHTQNEIAVDSTICSASNRWTGVRARAGGSQALAKAPTGLADQLCERGDAARRQPGRVRGHGHVTLRRPLHVRSERVRRADALGDHREHEVHLPVRAVACPHRSV